jgi:nucleoside-diphosphate-sugar epimerase
LVVLRDIVAPNAKLGFGEMEFNGVYLPAERFSIAALTEDTGFVPDVSFEAGIRKTAEWLRRE